MYALEDGNVKAECVVTDEGNEILEIKNIAVDPVSYTHLPRRSWKRVVQESDFFYREKLSKNTQVRLR